MYQASRVYEKKLRCTLFLLAVSPANLDEREKIWEAFRHVYSTETDMYRIAVALLASFLAPIFPAAQAAGIDIECAVDFAAVLDARDGLKVRQYDGSPGPIEPRVVSLETLVGLVDDPSYKIWQALQKVNGEGTPYREVRGVLDGETSIQRGLEIYNKAIEEYPYQVDKPGSLFLTLSGYSSDASSSSSWSICQQNDSEEIICNDSTGKFNLSKRTGRFVYLGLGEWHLGGDRPSFMLFGACKPRYD